MIFENNTNIGYEERGNTRKNKKAPLLSLDQRM
jgi:hypothetical protein